MKRQKEPYDEIMRIFKDRYPDKIDDFLVPPPVFTELGGEFIDVEVERGFLRARFPIQARFQNPYGVLQGGMIAAAIDNTLGPLSMLVAPPNLTRRLELKYSHPARIEDEYLVVEAKLNKRDGRWLHFTADARDPRRKLIARAQATHWVITD